MKTKILAVVENTTDAMAWYRSVLPMVRLMQDHDDIEVMWISPEVKPSWDILSQYHILFCHKPHSKSHVEMLSRAKAMKIKIWVDLDDEVWSLTTDHPAYNYHNSREHILRLQECLSLSDVITTSTEHLSQRTRDFAGPAAVVVTVDNACDIHGLQVPKKQVNTKSPNILWRGSYTHQKDLFDVKDSILEIDQDHDGLQWTFMGYNPFFITDGLREFTFIDHMPLTEFFGTLNKMPGHISIVPLTDTSFNRSKSCIAALEAIIAGRIPVCEHWWAITPPELKKPFAEQVKTLMAAEQNQMKEWYAWLLDRLYERHNLHVVNKERVKIIKGL